MILNDDDDDIHTLVKRRDPLARNNVFIGDIGALLQTVFRFLWKASPPNQPYVLFDNGSWMHIHTNLPQINRISVCEKKLYNLYASQIIII